MTGKIEILIKIYVIVIYWVIPSASYSQQTKLRGNVSYFNSKTLTGTKRYVPDAIVTDDFDRAQQTTTDQQGNFELFYYNVKEKDPISFAIKKQGLEVVNISALEAVAGQNGLVKISMARPEDIADYRRHLYKVGKTENERLLVKKIKSITDSIGILTGQRDIDHRLIELLQLKKDTLLEQQSQVENNASEFVRRYGSIDLDYASPLFKHAFELFQKGQIDAALTILAKANLPDDSRKKVRRRDSLINQDRKLQIDLAENNIELQDDIDALRLKGDLHMTKLEYDSALSCYSILMQIDSNTVKNVFQYAFILNSFGRIDSALKYYQMVLSKSPNIVVRAAALNNLSGLYELKDDYDDAFAVLAEALNDRRNLAKEYPELKSDYAITANNVGNYYLNKYRLDSAEYYYLLALNNFDTAQDNFNASAHGRIKTKVNIGILYEDFNASDSALHYLISALKDERSQNNYSNSQYDSELISILNSLGHCYLKTGDLKNARIFLNEALSHFNKSSQKDYASQYARTIYNLGNVEKTSNHFEKARQYLLPAYQIRTFLAKVNPKSFDYDYINILTALGEVYAQLNNPDSAFHLLSEALKIIDNHQQKRKDAFIEERAGALVNLANLLWSQNEFNEAKYYCTVAIKIYEQLSGTNHGAYQLELWDAQRFLGQVYYYNNQFDSSIYEYRKAIKLLPFMQNINSAAIDQRIEIIDYNIGSCYDDISSYDSSLKYLSAAYEKCQFLIKRDSSYLNNMALVNASLGNLCMDRTDLANAKVHYSASYSYYLKVYKVDTSFFEPLLSQRSNELGNCFRRLYDYDSAEYYYVNARNICSKYAKLNPGKYKPDLAMILDNLGDLYADKKTIVDIPKSLSCFSQAHDLYNELTKNHPQLYDSACALNEFRIGIAQIGMGNPDAAKKAFNDVLRICNDPMHQNQAFFLHLGIQTRTTLQKLEQLEN